MGGASHEIAGIDRHAQRAHDTVASECGSYSSLVHRSKRTVSILFEFSQECPVHIRARCAVPNKIKSSNHSNDSVYLRRSSKTRHKFTTTSIIHLVVPRIHASRKGSRMDSNSGMHPATPSTDVEIGPIPASQPFFSRVMTRFRVWRSRFERKDRQQVAPPQTTAHRVSGTIEAMELDLDLYLGTPIALISPSYSIRSSIRSGVVDTDWVVDRGVDFQGVTREQNAELVSSTFGNVLGLDGLPRMAMVDADGVLPTGFSSDDYLTQLEVCFLRWWASVAYRFGLGYAFDRQPFDLPP